MSERRSSGRFPLRELVCLAAMFTVLLTPGAPLAADVLVSGSGSGTDEDPYLVPRTECEMSIDAVLDESAWEGALVLWLPYEVQPGENIPSPVETEVLLTYDCDNLYAAFRCYDPEPSAVTANISDRDRISNGDDWVGLILDAFNDERRSFKVLVNAAGVQEDFIGTPTGNSSWDAIWDSAGRKTDWGYAIELSVPFKQLRFQRSDGPQIWGFDAVRSYPRTQRHHMGVFPRDRGNNCYLCQAVKISGFEGAMPGRNIEIAPTATWVRTDVRDDFPSGSLETEMDEADLGITARWGMTPNLTLSTAVNPDFSQIEADAIQLDINSPFALYYSERRPFFMEGGDFFRTLKRAFYSRAVRDPDWGVKVSGKEGVHTIGVGVMQDVITGILIPGSQYSSSMTLDERTTDSVLRYKLDVGSQYTLGAMVTDRRGDEYTSTMVAVDADLRPTQSDQFQGQVMWSTTEYPTDVAEKYEQPTGEFDDYFVALEYDHDGRNAYWWLDYDLAGPDFRADLGFIPRVGFRNVEGGLLYSLYNEPVTWWSDVTPSYDFWYYEDWDGRLLQKGNTLAVNFGGALQSYGYAGVDFYKEGYSGAEYDLVAYNATVGLRPSNSVSTELSTSFGDRIDYSNGRLGERFRVDASLSSHLGGNLVAGIAHDYEQLDVDGGRLYTANISALEARYHFNVRTSVRAVLQYLGLREERRPLRGRHRRAEPGARHSVPLLVQGQPANCSVHRIRRRPPRRRRAGAQAVRQDLLREGRVRPDSLAASWGGCRARTSTGRSRSNSVRAFPPSVEGRGRTRPGTEPGEARCLARPRIVRSVCCAVR